ncbi:MAG: hypothetical protein K5697_08405 [Lachnospiraceae bacterium]|nr:hypothetical protein [Lachnospiraceae bacterium]
MKKQKSVIKRSGVFVLAVMLLAGCGKASDQSDNGSRMVSESSGDKYVEAAEKHAPLGESADEAVSVIEEAVENVVVDKDDPAIRKALEEADNCSKNRQFDKAIPFYLDVLSKNDSVLEAYGGLIGAYLFLYEGETAKVYYDLAKEKLSEEEFEQIEKLVKSLNVGNEMLIDAVHASVLTALIDPELKKKKDYDAVVSKWFEETDLNAITREDGYIEEEALDILGAENGADVAARLTVLGENEPHIKVKFTSDQKLAVWVDGHEELDWDYIYGDSYDD